MSVAMRHGIVSARPYAPRVNGLALPVTQPPQATGLDRDELGALVAARRPNIEDLSIDRGYRTLVITRGKRHCQRLGGSALLRPVSAETPLPTPRPADPAVCCPRR
jgi:hypothetical protein